MSLRKLLHEKLCRPLQCMRPCLFGRTGLYGATWLQRGRSGKAGLLRSLVLAEGLLPTSPERVQPTFGMLRCGCSALSLCGSRLRDALQLGRQAGRQARLQALVTNLPAAVLESRQQRVFFKPVEGRRSQGLPKLHIFPSALLQVCSGLSIACLA